MEFTNEFFNKEVAKGSKPFTLTIEKDVKETRRSDLARENKVYYLKMHLLGKPKEPLHFNPINTSSNIKSKSADKENKVKKNPVDSMSVVIRLDLKEETDEELNERAEIKVDELMKIHDIPAERRKALINNEINKIKGVKELSQSIKYVDEYFKVQMERRAIMSLLKKHCECKQKIKSNAGVIIYERNLNDEEETKVKNCMRENKEGEFDDCDDTQRLSYVEKYLENVKFNIKTGKVFHEFPMVYLEVPVTKSTGVLSVDILDLSKFTTDKHTGERKYKRATTLAKGPNGKISNVGLDFYNVANFITYGSLILGMMEFTITISQTQGPKLHVKLIDQLYVRKGKASRVKKKVAKSTVSKTSSLLDAEDAFYDNEPEENNNNLEEEVNKEGLDGVDDDTDNVSDDAY